MQPMPEDWNRAVAVVAHPDDLEYGVASAVARWTGQGKHVSYLLATRGEAGIAGMTDQVGPLRVEEEPQSAAIVGVTEVEFLDCADGLVEYGIALQHDLAAAFRRLQPEVIITMNFDLTWGEEGPVNHADHRAVGLATLDAHLPGAANEWIFPEAGPPCTSIRDAYVAAVGVPTHFVDVTDTIDAGVASLREHRAYIEGLGGKFDPDEFLKNMAGYVGLGAGCEYAVSFRRYPMG